MHPAENLEASVNLWITLVLTARSYKEKKRMGKKMEDSCFMVVSDRTMLGTKKKKPKNYK